MGRKSVCRYYASKGGYFTTVAGKRHRLATGAKDDPTVQQEALRRFALLLAGLPAPSRDAAVPTVYVAQLHPDSDPHVLKVGKTLALRRRVNSFRTICPSARVFLAFAVPRADLATVEASLLGILPAFGCAPLAREVFRAGDLTALERDIAANVLAVCPAALRVSL